MHKIGRLFIVLSLTVGCGPSAEERTLSKLNLEADRWAGGPKFSTTATDGYGNRLASSIETGPINYVLEVRSHGADGLPKNSDDLYVVRSQPHGESSVTKEVGKSLRDISKNAAAGTIEGIKEGIGIGKKEADEVDPN